MNNLRTDDIYIKKVIRYSISNKFIGKLTTGETCFICRNQSFNKSFQNSNFLDETTLRLDTYGGALPVAVTEALAFAESMSINISLLCINIDKEPVSTLKKNNTIHTHVQF